MEPVSGLLLLLVCGLTAGCVAAAVVLWPRLGGPGARPLLARSGTLLATQALMTVSAVLLANRYFVFYATWNDLLGGDTAQVRVERVQPSGGVRMPADEPVRRMPTDLGPRRPGRERDPAADGRVDRLRFRGARSGLAAELYVYLPPQYFQAAYAGRRLPVVMVLADGAADGKADAGKDPSAGAMAWIRQGRLPSAADDAEGPGNAQPMVYAMVGQGHGCIDVPGRSAGASGLAETFLSQDVPEALADTYRLPRTRKGWGLLGLAAGGHCAARLAMLHSDRFAAAAALGGRFGLPPAPPAGPGGDPYGGSRAYRLDNDLLWRLENLPPPPVAVLAAAGTGGEDAREAERFTARVKPPMMTGSVLVPGSPGTLRQWRGRLRPVLEWTGAHLRGE
ncbi:hypothetical protein AGRA3207_002815 [Actinomadura graeca]|uniref:Esterase n=1 Tax=Actinomadura graeca TaxID=2750812 RepID=A0ABX8QSU6_9ACTN|nr:alpha/beta hydrolase-fold protein [Actinomadura graeca]QXJ21906.1 hypothetical protein AGRA3207_002815 [Actinomadura graeca]